MSMPSISSGERANTSPPRILPCDTAQVIGENAKHCESRSLLFDRFADPRAKEDDRREVFERAMKACPCDVKRRSWSFFVKESLHGPAGRFLFGELKSRLMVNMAGGVMENAGLCLDRYGLPYIPGSAVKGCARRTALAALHEWCMAGGVSGNKLPEDHPLADCCKPFCSAEEMFVEIALVFGWCEEDWKDDRSDFRWALGKTQWAKMKESVTERTLQVLPHLRPHHQGGPKSFRRQNYGGSVAFLPAYPVASPLGPDLELDVVTCHHRDYYEGKRPVATDTEDPNPVVFPAVAKGHLFLFPLLPLRGSDARRIELAESWLKVGLEVFGIGAKTRAGYGWFDCCDDVQEKGRKALVETAEQILAEHRRKLEEQRKAAEEERKRREKEEENKRLENMSAEQRADYRLAQLTDDQFRGHLMDFLHRSLDEQKAIVRALRRDPSEPNSRRAFWEDLKQKARKGGKPAHIEQAIRKLSKEMYPGKEGKMP